MTKYEAKAVSLDLADWEHVCATIGDAAGKFQEMGEDKEFADQEAGRDTSDEDRAVWAQHATYLMTLHRRIKEQAGLPR